MRIFGFHIVTCKRAKAHADAIAGALEAHERVLVRSRSLDAIDSAEALHGALRAAAVAMKVQVRPLSGGLPKPPKDA